MDGISRSKGAPTPPERFFPRFLHLSHSTSGGGAARAALRIHNSLDSRSDCKSVIFQFVQDSSPDPETPACIKSEPKFSQKPLINRFLTLVRHFLSPTSSLLFDFFFARNRVLETQLLTQAPSLIIAHWVKPRDLPLRSIRQLGTPIAFVLHDARFILGLRHYPLRNELRNGLVRFTFIERIVAGLIRKALRNTPITLVSPSEWMNGVARTAGWPDSRAWTIPYPVDTDFWRPSPSPKNRDLISIGFGFTGKSASHRKGEDLFWEAIRLLEDAADLSKARVEVLCFGNASPISWVVNESRFKVVTLGHLNDKQLRSFFSRVDLVVLPSRHENLAQVALEAQACGTPVLVSRNTGLETAISRRTGWTFENGSHSDLSRTLAEIIANPKELSDRARRAPDHIALNFSDKTISSSYLEMFNSLIYKS